jgi:hypothetical protein
MQGDLVAVESADYSGRMLAETASGMLACPGHAQRMKNVALQSSTD